MGFHCSILLNMNWMGFSISDDVEAKAKSVKPNIENLV